MKYKVGDKVQVRSQEWYDEHKDVCGAVLVGRVLLGPDMVQFLGKSAVISEVDVVDSTYMIDIDNYWWYCDEMFEDTSEVTKEVDWVNQPPHYTEGGVECIVAIESSMTKEAFLGFLKGQVVKYMWRYEKKTKPLEDVKKARFYLNRMIQVLEGE